MTDKPTATRIAAIKEARDMTRRYGKPWVRAMRDSINNKRARQSAAFVIAAMIWFVGLAGSSHYLAGGS